MDDIADHLPVSTWKCPSCASCSPWLPFLILFMNQIFVCQLLSQNAQRNLTSSHSNLKIRCYHAKCIILASPQIIKYQRTYISVDSLTVLSMSMYSSNTSSNKYWNTNLQDMEDFFTKNPDKIQKKQESY